MMRQDEYDSYASEIGTLQRLLEGITEDRAIERRSLETRLRRLRERIRDVAVAPTPKRVAVTFTGKPVHDNYGIDANFGATAVSLFSDTIRIATAAMTGELKDTGQIPRNALGQPVITDVAVGSFGFELELPAATGQPDSTSFSEDAAIKVQDLLRLSNEGSDDELSEIANDLHPRAVNKVTQLLEFMARREAQFAMDFDGKEFRFHSDEEVGDSVKRLAPSNIEERTDTVTGVMIGVVPARRYFELSTGDGTPIEGRIGREIGNLYGLAERYTNQRVTTRIRSVRVGRGGTRYTLTAVQG